MNYEGFCLSYTAVTAPTRYSPHYPGEIRSGRHLLNTFVDPVSRVFVQVMLI
jgi:hypothetical protein